MQLVIDLFHVRQERDVTSVSLDNHLFISHSLSRLLDKEDVDVSFVQAYCHGLDGRHENLLALLCCGLFLVYNIHGLLVDKCGQVSHELKPIQIEHS